MGRAEEGGLQGHSHLRPAPGPEATQRLGRSQETNLLHRNLRTEAWFFWARLFGRNAIFEILKKFFWTLTKKFPILIHIFTSRARGP